MKGIILAGGSGTRLFPLTKTVSKQLLPVYDKPMIYYPLSILMNMGIREILIITTVDQEEQFYELLGDGDQFGIELHYKSQLTPNGIAEAFIIGANFIGNDNVTLILGDNIFHGFDFNKLNITNIDGGLVFAYNVSDPERYGVVEFNSKGDVLSLEEKPKNPKSNYAVTGLYVYDNSVVEKALNLKPSFRGELEITDINKFYLKENKLSVAILERGTAWLDTGTHDSLMEASQYVETIQKRQGYKIACLEEIAYQKGFIEKSKLKYWGNLMKNNDYGQYLLKLYNVD